MLNELQLANEFKMAQLPIKNWDGLPRYYSNLKKFDLSFTQRFGQSLLDYSQFNLKGHNGIDIGGLKGAPIAFPCKLWVTTTHLDTDGYGNYVFAETEVKKINGDYYKLEMVFGHLETILCSAARWYDAGKDVGTMNSTGFSTGNHLHFGIRPLWSADGNTWKQMFYGNGYAGYIDPEPFLPHIVYDMDEILHPKKGMGNFKPKGFKQVKNPDGTYSWVAIK